jgi:hypothetical protein
MLSLLGGLEVSRTRAGTVVDEALGGCWMRVWLVRTMSTTGWVD